ncbi:hypothetical protein MTBSS4_90048 [Magnetospirillum sp. SS-4]|nr:hypothetical protein MTBSS4_90048 [Magnetospirillum sp. SS-4]
MHRSGERFNAGLGGKSGSHTVTEVSFSCLAN